jgi:hypothetical protein
MRGRCAFRKADLTRAMKAVLAAGINVAKIEIDLVTGKIAVIPRDSSSTEQINDLDKWIADNAHPA